MAQLMSMGFTREQVRCACDRSDVYIVWIYIFICISAADLTLLSNLNTHERRRQVLGALQRTNGSVEDALALLLAQFS